MYVKLLFDYESLECNKYCPFTFVNSNFIVIFLLHSNKIKYCSLNFAELNKKSLI